MVADIQSVLNMLRAGLSELQIPFQETHIVKFQHYLQALLSLPHNLTAIKSAEDSITHHFLDSLAALPLMNQFLMSSFCDIGSGAGFPLLPIKIIHPEIDCTFIDSRTKSTTFIESICQQLKLDHCKTIHEHTSQLRKQKKILFPVIISRAFGNVTYILQECLSLLEPDGHFILYKGPQVHEEIKDIPKKLLSFIDISSINEIKVPFLDKKRFLLIIKKHRI